MEEKVGAGKKIAAWFKKINSSMSMGRKIAICFGAILISCMIFWLGLLAGNRNPIEEIDLNNTNVLTGDLSDNGKELVFTTELSEDFAIRRSVLFKSSHAVVEVLLDGEVIYTFGTQKPVVGKSPGTCWHVVNVPAGSAGHTLTIRRTSVYNSYKGSDSNFYYGSRGDCILRLVDNFLYVLIMNAISIVLGVICFLLHFRTVKKKDIQEKSGFLWIGLFAIIIAVWSLRQCGFLRILIPNSEILYFIDIHTLFLAAVPLDMFVYMISRTKWGKSCIWFIPAYLIGLLFGMIMQVAGVFDIVQMLTVLHAYIAVNAIYMFWAVHREAWRNKGSAVGRFRFPLYTIVAFGIMEIIHYYMPSRTTSVFLPTGVMVFILLLVWQQVGAYFHMLEEQKLHYYEKFANTDLLTGAFNRNAYETKLKKIGQEETDLNGYGVVLFDLNGLKYINDNFGHEKGDEAIKRCYELIVTAFGDKDNCYRIGGDEFVYLNLSEAEAGQKIADFDALLVSAAQSLSFPFNVAFGYAVFDAERDKDLQDTIKRSDAMMYLDKQEKKQRQQTAWISE